MGEKGTPLWGEGCTGQQKPVKAKLKSTVRMRRGAERGKGREQKVKVVIAGKALPNKRTEGSGIRTLKMKS